jgi:hypothetical protein
LLGKRTQGRLFRTFEDFEFRATFTDRKNTPTVTHCRNGKKILLTQNANNGLFVVFVSDHVNETFHNHIGFALTINKD